MNRTKIEEMLKVAEKEYSSVKFLSDSKSFMKMKIAQAKIQLLTSLLAEDGGEVKEEGCKLIAHATGEGWHLAVSNEDGDEVELDFDFVVPKRFNGYITTSQLKSLGFEIV